MAYLLGFSSRPGCFVMLPSAALVSPSDSQSQPAYHARTADGRSLYLVCNSWSAPAGRLLMHRQMARALRLTEGQPLSLSQLPAPAPACRHARLSAESDSDYELLCMSGARLQDTLLDRAAVVWPGARLPIWLDSRNVVQASVVSVDPAQCCRLARMTELEIVPPGAGSGGETEVPAAPDGSVGMLTQLRRLLGLRSSEEKHPAVSGPEWSLRAQELPAGPGLGAADAFLANRACLCLRADLPVDGGGWCEARPLLAPEQCLPALVYVVAADALTEADPLRAAALAVGADSLLSPGAALLPGPVRRQLRLSVGERVRLTRLTPPADGAASQLTLVWHSARLPVSALETVRHALAGWQACCTGRDVWWRSGALLRLADEQTLQPFDVLLECDSDVFRVAAPLSAELVISSVSQVYGGEAGLAWPLTEDALPDLSLPPPPGEDTHYTCYLAEEKRLYGWCRRALASGGALGHVLVSGASGVGKSALVGQVCRRLARPPLCAYTVALDCSALLGKKPEAVVERVAGLVRSAERRRPAVLVLDSLDALLPAETDGAGEPSQRAAYFSQLASALCDQLTERRPGVLVLAVLGRAGLHAELRRPAGQHVFGLEMTLSAADTAGRACQLRQLCGKHAQLTELQWRRLAERCRGCVARDLKKIVTRARLGSEAGRTPAFASQPADAAVSTLVSHASVHRSPPRAELSSTHSSPARSGSRLTEACLTAAMDGFTPASLQLLQQSRPAPVTWGQLGGLQLLRRQLVAALQRPLQYPCLHARAGRPPQPRALLYGPPGTGKTLLARALADNSDINFFTVKGPELLSKYIGASEMAVRDLFERASRASPAIIFFDEFESLAPRRGHDSTGVTDRVVNQLLTLLDGAETPSGGAQVALLAASSRPDLLDPALLRPGRIGRLLRCPLPDAAARQEILCALTRDVPLAADVQWSPVVARTGGLTGADLRALVADAQLRAVRETLTAAELTCGAAARSEQEAVAVRQVAGPPMDAAEARTALQHGPLAESDAGAAGTAPPPAVAWRHVEAALADLRPSLSVTERRKYEAVYEQFERGRGEAGGGAVQSGARPRQRVSLA